MANDTVVAGAAAERTCMSNTWLMARGQHELILDCRVHPRRLIGTWSAPFHGAEC